MNIAKDSNLRKQKKNNMIF